MGLFQKILLVISILCMIFHLVILIVMSSELSSFNLKLIHRDSIESPFYPGPLTFEEQVRRDIKTSNYRASYLESIATGKKYRNPNLISPYILLDGYMYLVHLGIGDPVKYFLLLLDTGSGLSWVQCEPCKKCYPQKYPIYDSKVSKTYAKISCNDPYCKQYTCKNEQCMYSITYGDGGTTEGVLSWENFVSQTPKKGMESISPVLFGCSNYNDDSKFLYAGSAAAGILGMDWSPTSFISQLGIYALNRFSYCFGNYLPNGTAPPSYLKFGTDMGYRGGAVKTTPFVKHPFNQLYYLNLLDISVNDKPLNFPPDTFKTKSDRTGGCLIDSGTAISYFETDAYEKIEHEFINYFSPFKLERLPGCPVPTRLCYFMPPNFKSFPRMTYHFQGANLTIEPEQVFIIAHHTFTLALAPFKQLTILGAHQQQNKRFTYDLNDFTLSFVPENCNEDEEL